MPLSEVLPMYKLAMDVNDYIRGKYQVNHSMVKSRLDSHPRYFLSHGEIPYF